MNLTYWVASILLPFISMVYLGVRFQNKKRYILMLCMVEVIANALVLLLKTRFADTWTSYECLLVNAIVSIVAVQVCAMVLERKKPNCHDTLKTVCFICFSVAAYSSLTYGQAHIHSDSATSILLTKSQIEHASLFPASWNYANGEIWTLSTHIFVLPFTVLLKNQSLARALGSVFIFTAASCGIVWLSKRIFKNDSWTLAIPLFIVFIAGYSAREEILYEAAYDGQMLWMTAELTLFILALQTRKKRYILGYMLIAFAQCAGGVRFVIEQSLPVFMAYAFYIYLEIREKESIAWWSQTKRAMSVGSMTMLPAMAGLFVYNWLCGWHNVNNTSNSAMVLTGSLYELWNNLVNSVIQLFECFGYSGGGYAISVAGIGSLVSIAICVLVCFVIPLLQGMKIRRENHAVRLFYFFGIAHNLLLFGSKILFNLMETPRYMLTIAFVSIIISARYIYVYWIEQTNFRKAMWTGLFAFAALIQCLVLIANNANWTDDLLAKKAFNQALVEAGQTKGYATYWNAYNNEVYSDMRIRYGGVSIGEGCIARFSWLVDEDVFTPCDSDTFLLLTESERQVLGPDIPAMFGQPREIIEDNGYCAYLFDHDIVTDFERGAADGVIRPIEMIGNDGVNRTEDALALSQGGVVDSMNVSLAAGEYDVKLVGDNLSACYCEILSASDPWSIEYCETERADEEIDIRLSLGADLSDIVFRAVNETEPDQIELRTIYVDRIEAAA